MKATRFMRQPFYVTGYEVNEDNMELIAKWCQGHVIRDGGRPFVRVPVDRATTKRQTEAYAGTWVTCSIQRGEKSFKVYSLEWLEKNFIRLPDDDIEALERAGCINETSGSEATVSATVVAQFQAPSI